MARVEVKNVTSTDRELIAIVGPDRHLPRHTDTSVVRLTRISSGDWFDVLRPAPPRLEGPSTESEITNCDDVHVAVILERTPLARGVDALYI
jgi:hypothetical protein